ncbi:MAG: hypothetical protein R2762_23345 [Bryobacteraceae bacterium]
MSTRPQHLWRSIAAAALAAVIWSVGASAPAQNKPHIVGPMPAKDGETCVVCNSRVSKDDLAYVIDGQRVAVMRAMEADLLANPLEYVTKFRPEGMIFSNQQSKRESGAFFWGGVLVLAGLMFGGACAHMAVEKGLSAAMVRDGASSFRARHARPRLEVARHRQHRTVRIAKPPGKPRPRAPVAAPPIILRPMPAPRRSSRRPPYLRRGACGEELAAMPGTVIQTLQAILDSSNPGGRAPRGGLQSRK